MFQLLPFLRLDGFFLLTDLSGVPDLGDRIGPLLRGVLPGRGGAERPAPRPT